MLKSSYICFYNLQLGHPGYIMVFHVQAAWFCHVCESSIHKHAFFFKITVINEQAKWTSPASEMWSQAQRSKGNAKNQVKKHRGDASRVGQCRSLVHLICILAVSPNALTHLDLVGPSGLDVGASMSIWRQGQCSHALSMASPISCSSEGYQKFKAWWLTEK